MRILAGRCWLTATALLLGTAKGGGGDNVTFISGFEGDFDGNTRLAIFRLGQLNSKTFTWNAPGVVVNKINLWAEFANSESVIASGVRTDDSGTSDITGGASTSTISTSTGVSPTTGGSPSPIGTPDPKGKQSGGSHRPRQASPVSGNLAVESNNVSFSQLTLTGNIIDFMSIPLYLEVEWGSGGKIYSRLFTFTNDITFGAMNDSQRDMYADDHPHKDEIDPHTAATPSGQPPSIETSVPPSGEQPVGQASIPAPSGLSSAAVIGIAVGCGVAGLGAIFALVWFLLRRRRQQKDLLPVGSYRSNNRAEDLMAEKEGNADVSPHSPYSDDGITGGAGAGVNTTYQDGLAHVDGPEAVAAGAAAAPPRSHLQDQPRSLTPYSDRLSGGGGVVVGTPSTRAASVAHTDEARVSIPSPTPGRATPRALTTPYAHLIEEGMTEEEIRRLEEEERQLDAAIEQAGRR